MEHIWRTGEELGPVSGDSTNKEPLVFPGALLRNTMERPLSLLVFLRPPWVRLGSMEEMLE